MKNNYPSLVKEYLINKEKYNNSYDNLSKELDYLLPIITNTIYKIFSAVYDIKLEDIETGFYTNENGTYAITSLHYDTLTVSLDINKIKLYTDFSIPYDKILDDDFINNHILEETKVRDEDRSAAKNKKKKQLENKLAKIQKQLNDQ